MGSSGLEPPTSRLSGARSNHLSYEPTSFFKGAAVETDRNSPHGGIAQLGERLPCKQEAIGSIPIISTIQHIENWIEKTNVKATNRKTIF